MVLLVLWYEAGAKILLPAGASVCPVSVLDADDSLTSCKYLALPKMCPQSSALLPSHSPKNFASEESAGSDPLIGSALAIA